MIDMRLERNGESLHVRTDDGDDGKGRVELVLVDGEDLSAYRRASGAVKWIVDSVVGFEQGTSGKRKRDQVSFSLPFWPWDGFRARVRGYGCPESSRQGRSTAYNERRAQVSYTLSDA